MSGTTDKQRTEAEMSSYERRKLHPFLAITKSIPHSNADIILAIQESALREDPDADKEIVPVDFLDGY